MEVRILVLTVVMSTGLSAAGQEWKATPQSDALTGKPYTSYELTGRFLTPPTRGNEEKPSIYLRCDPSAHRGRISGKFIDGFIRTTTVIALTNGGASTVQYRLDDGKVQTASSEIGTSTDFKAISMTGIFLNNILWGHMIPHKPGSSEEVHKFVISVQEYLAGQVVMQFDLPDAQQIGAACGTEYK